MKTIIASVGLIFLAAFVSVNNFYSYSVTTWDGKDISLDQYRGKKVLLVVLPASKTTQDSILLVAMDSLVTFDTIAIIGIPSYEDGFQDDSLESLTTWYKSLAGDSIVITQGMNTRKTSPYQSDLFAWLTSKDLNGHFDQDVMGAGTKYLINEAGELYGVGSSESLLTDDFIK